MTYSLAHAVNFVIKAGRGCLACCTRDGGPTPHCGMPIKAHSMTTMTAAASCDLNTSYALDTLEDDSVSMMQNSLRLDADSYWIPLPCGHFCVHTTKARRQDDKRCLLHGIEICQCTCRSSCGVDNVPCKYCISTVDNAVAAMPI